MKKKNLNFLLALLAALALVFAGACSDGSDDADSDATPGTDDTTTGGGASYSSYSGSTYVYSGTSIDGSDEKHTVKQAYVANSPGIFLDNVKLAFASGVSSTVTITAEYALCTTSGGSNYYHGGTGESDKVSDDASVSWADYVAEGCGDAYYTGSVTGTYTVTDDGVKVYIDDTDGDVIALTFTVNATNSNALDVDVTGSPSLSIVGTTTNEAAADAITNDDGVDIFADSDTITGGIASGSNSFTRQ